MQKEFIIKKSPLLKIVLNKTSFEIINDQYKEESGIFYYSKLYDIGFKEKSTDYLTTIFLAIVSFILPGPSISKMTFKERIRMNYNGKEENFILFNFDKGTTIEAITEIQKFINPKYSTLK